MPAAVGLGSCAQGTRAGSHTAAGPCSGTPLVHTRGHRGEPVATRGFPDPGGPHVSCRAVRET